MATLSMTMLASRLGGASLVSGLRARAGGAALQEAVTGQRMAQLQGTQQRALQMTTPVMMGRRAAKIAARKVFSHVSYTLGVSVPLACHLDAAIYQNQQELIGKPRKPWRKLSSGWLIQGKTDAKKAKLYGRFGKQIQQAYVPCCSGMFWISFGMFHCGSL